jgi:hypothetical protein
LAALDETRFVSQPLRLTLEASPLGKDIFPSLPPLYNGHSDVHLRNGIMNASLLADNQDRNAERAFFVADLGVVYAQYQRWKKYLPYIQPFYGSHLMLVFFFSQLAQFFFMNSC